jgi:hypothetical protein
MKNYIVHYTDENGNSGFFDAPALNSVGAFTDFLSWCVESEINPVFVSVVIHD